MSAKRILLNDEQMRHYVVNGYITLNTDLPAGFHQDIYQQIATVFDTEGNPGNNLLPRIPALQRVFDDPAVNGALTSILGPDYFMHPHRYCHANPPGSTGQKTHRDSMSRNRHHTRWAMAFYYPQDTPVELGPTAVLPGSHYYYSRDADAVGEPLPGSAGTVTVVHYDLWHRAAPNTSNQTRYMVKFLFTRMEEPQSPSWNSKQAAWQPVGHEAHEPMFEHLWDWHYGKVHGNGRQTSPAATGSVTKLREALQDRSESVRLGAAYALGAIGKPALSDLLESLRSAAGRYASYALTVIGRPAVPELVTLAGEDNESVRALAVETLGDMGLVAQDAVPALIHALEDESDQVRRRAALALGTTGQWTSAAVPALIRTLHVNDDELIRRNTSLSLARIGKLGRDYVEGLQEILQDENRYVRAKMAFALQRIDTPESQDALLDFLWTSRWCHTTSNGSDY